jgi:hypothetical protein
LIRIKGDGLRRAFALARPGDARAAACIDGALSINPRIALRTASLDQSRAPT